MRSRIVVRAAVTLAALVVLAAMSPGTSLAASNGRSGRYLVLARNGADYNALRAKALRGGARVIADMPQVGTLVVSAPDSVRRTLAADPRAIGVAPDHLQRVAPVDGRQVSHLPAPGPRSATRSKVTAAGARASGITPDPAFGVPGLQWDFARIGLPRGWRTSAGSRDVTVAVADTGLDFTHPELASKVTRVVDLTRTENPPICKTQFGTSDADLAARFGGPETTDWNGHGSWIGGNIAAALDGRGINGIAPRVNLVSLKISQWCGSAFDSTLIRSFILAADLGVDVVNISFGGYLDRGDRDQDLIYRSYVAAVAYARNHGTVIVAAAGNEHTRVGAGGKVLTHGTLTTPGGEVFDAFGQFETPGGIPGVVDVASTGNVVNAPSASCAPGTIGTPSDPNATCKPTADAHQSFGVGRRSQLSYFSNYGPRIDIAAPGGARSPPIRWSAAARPDSPTPTPTGPTYGRTSASPRTGQGRSTASPLPAAGSPPASATRRSRGPRWPPRTWRRASRSSRARTPTCGTTSAGWWRGSRQARWTWTATSRRHSRRPTPHRVTCPAWPARPASATSPARPSRTTTPTARAC